MKTFPLMWIDVKTNVTAAGTTLATILEEIFIRVRKPVVIFNLKNIEVGLTITVDLTWSTISISYHLWSVFDITAVTVLRPVEQNNGNVMVNWSTSSESNTSAFKVMRALSETGLWIQVGA
jgi:hypothetical protein